MKIDDVVDRHRIPLDKAGRRLAHDRHVVCDEFRLFTDPANGLGLAEFSECHLLSGWSDALDLGACDRFRSKQEARDGGQAFGASTVQRSSSTFDARRMS
ncbi:hypothetical protein [Branchiibius hedensis]|uniref:hypothetical protein n=1 Tax=Branchiibius hedensis TaxID=672460 RepID=UPI001FEC9AE8|nr:hypothetical protein [Branchiibius hedensis]